jgi:23S rRNA (cytosine1962-C5)-methyltransferase
VLNLFAYTGGSTLAAAATGAAVVHVDAARSAVAWARRNAAASGLSEAPIRWIVDDARKFAAQERKRGKHYDGVILDPPSYGHGSGGEAWKLERDLEPLLADCAALTGPNPGFMLLSCHAPGYGAEELAALLRRWFPHAKMDADDMHLATDDGHLLHSGARSRFAASES